MNRIHFLGTGYSDCIILESNGKFAMIDAAEDTEYPPDKPHLKLPGFEKEVVEYINKHCKNDDGKIVFEFILGTHAHSDHIGGFDTVILQDNVEIKKAFLKPYHEEGINFYERKRWDNLEVYEQMLNALKLKNIPVIESFDRETETLGEMIITFYNGSYIPINKKIGENRNSAVALVECNDFRALLVGDMNYSCGGERMLADEIGKVDLLKVGHHGYLGSSSSYFIKNLSPDFAVICNYKIRVDLSVLHRLKNVSCAVYCTSRKGVVFTIGDKIEIKTDIM